MSRRRDLRRLLAWSFAAAVVAQPLLVSGAAGASSSPPEQAKCTRQPGVFQEGPAVSPKTVLTPDVPTQTINFGGGRGWQFADVVLRVSQPLPTTFNPAQLDIQVLRRFTRQSDTLSTVAIDPPLFTEPQINPRRNAITFTICVHGANLGAGHYAGAITAEGPAGIEATNVALNINAQDQSMFLWTAIPTAILVLFLLFWRGAVTVKNQAARSAAADVAAAAGAAAAAGGAGAVQVAAPTATAATNAQASTWALKWEVLMDPLFWATTILSAAAGFAAAWAIYAANTGWGSDPVTDIFAVVAGILSAVGLRSLIASAAGS
jgi:hypothetical protein